MVSGNRTGAYRVSVQSPHPIVRLIRLSFDKTLNQTVPHQRDDNADYQLVVGAFIALVGMIGGAGSIAKPCVIWSVSALRNIAGWVKFPVETSIGRLFKERSHGKGDQPV